MKKFFSICNMYRNSRTVRERYFARVNVRVKRCGKRVNNSSANSWFEFTVSKTKKTPCRYCLHSIVVVMSTKSWALTNFGMWLATPLSIAERGEIKMSHKSSLWKIFVSYVFLIKFRLIGSLKFAVVWTKTRANFCLLFYLG